MQQVTKRILSVLLVVCMVLSLAVAGFAAPASEAIITTATGYITAADVVYSTTDGIIANWGARGEVCYFLSSYGENFYTGDYTYDALSALAGGTSTSNATSSALYTTLQTFVTNKQTSFTAYGTTKTNDCKYLYLYTDCVSSDTTQVSQFYRGNMVGSTWDSGVSYNQEHVWPQSKLSGSSSTDVGDIMHLRPAHSSENSSRNNTAYGESDGYYDPGVSVRGDCARTVLYMYTRWGNTDYMWGEDGVIESLDILLKWMEEDPVDTWEMGRNDAVQSITGARNVYVDYPELAWQLFGVAEPADLVTPTGSDYPGETTPTEPVTATTATLVTDVSTLKAGDEIVIVASDYAYAISTTQNSNNRGQAEITKSADNTVVTLGDDSQIIKLEAGTVDGTFAFNVGEAGYLYAASSSSNYLKTSTTLNDNGAWAITIDAATGVATVTASGTNTRNTLFYNASSKLFSCYAADSTTQKAVSIYKVGGTTVVDPDEGTEETTKTAQLVTDSSALKAGDQLLIVAADKDFALSTTQNTNNRGQAVVTKDGTSVSFGDDAQIITLENGTLAGTFAFNVGEAGYLYAASSSSNHLKTSTTLNDNGAWNITIDAATGVASIVSAGTSTRDDLRYNVTSGLFACYASNTEMATVSVYKIAGADTGSCNHSYKSVTTDATCSAAGTVVYTCTLCGDTYSQSIPMLDHSYVSVTTDATCTEAGQTVHTCSVCSSSYTETIAAKGHSYVDGTCSVCGETMTVIPTELTIDFSSTADRTSFSTEQQIWAKEIFVLTNNKGSSTSDVADYSNPVRFYKNSALVFSGIGIEKLELTCSSAAYATALNNSITTDANVTNSVSDTVVTIVFSEPVDTYEIVLSDGQVRMKQATAYFATAEAPHEHDYTAVVTAPTCTEEGYTTYTCSCGYSTVSDIVAALGHNYVDGTCSACGDVQAPPVSYAGRYYIATIRSSGNYFYMTNDLGTASTKRYQVEDSGLTVLPTEITAPASNKIFVLEQNEDGTYSIYAEGITADAKYLGHTSGNSGTLVEAASALALTVDYVGGIYNIHFDNDGTERYLALNNTSGNDYFAWYKSGQKQDLVLIPVNGTHSHSYTAKVTAPTCTADGYTTYTCSCGDSYVSDTVAALGHSYTADVTAPTCTADGYTTYTCTVCGDTYTDDVVAAAGHSYEGVTTDATCTVDGKTVYTCSACGDSYTETIAASGHSYSNGSCTVCGEADPDYVKPVTKPTLNLVSPALNFEDEIYYNIYYTVSDITDVVEMGLITFNSSVTDGTVENADAVIPGYVQSGSNYMSHTNGIPAKMLGDALYFKAYAKLSDGSYVYSGMQGYHAVAYAKDILANSSNAKMKALVVAMLNYGAAAQVHFDYKTDALVNSFLTEDQKALIDAYSSDMVEGLTKVDTSKVGAFAGNGGYKGIAPNVVFEGAFAINLYFTAANSVDSDVKLYYWTLDDYNAAETLTAENATGVVVTEETSTAGQYVGAITDIAAKQIDQTVFFCAVYESNGTSYCTGVFSYSLASYCLDRVANGSATMQEFAKETIVYGYYAKAYFA